MEPDPNHQRDRVGVHGRLRGDHMVARKRIYHAQQAALFSADVVRCKISGERYEGEDALCKRQVIIHTSKMIKPVVKSTLTTTKGE